MESEVDSSRVREGHLSPQDLRNLGDAVNLLSRAPIYIDDTPSIGIGELRAKARRLHAEHRFPVKLFGRDGVSRGGPSGSDTQHGVLASGNGVPTHCDAEHVCWSRGYDSADDRHLRPA